MFKFYVSKFLELIGLTSLAVGLVIGVGNHTDLALPLGSMSPERAMGIELLFFIAGMAIFGLGFWMERRVS